MYKVNDQRYTEHLLNVVQPFSNLHKIVLKPSGESLKFSCTKPLKPTFSYTSFAADHFALFSNLILWARAVANTK